ncbi:MAG TPA: sigma-70 family RNA polymerase sigma factor [Herpetosiphonaceae bacterium]
MSASGRDELQALWRQLARRNDWSLVTDEDAFLDQVMAELRRLEGPNTSVHPRIAIQRTYSALLYRGLQSRSNQAGGELWIAMFRLSLRDGWSEAEAQDLAQETVARILERLPALAAPQSLLAWAIMILRTVWRDYRKSSARSAGEQLVEELPEPGHMTAVVEHDTLMATLVREIRQRLTNPLEQQVFLRWLVLGDPPRDIAEDLGLSPHRIRTAKSRALQRLEADEQFRDMLRRLTEADEPSEAGADDDES